MTKKECTKFCSCSASADFQLFGSSKNHNNNNNSSSSSGVGVGIGGGGGLETIKAARISRREWQHRQVVYLGYVRRRTN